MLPVDCDVAQVEEVQRYNGVLLVSGVWRSSTEEFFGSNDRNSFIEKHAACLEPRHVPTRCPYVLGKRHVFVAQMHAYA